MFYGGYYGTFGAGSVVNLIVLMIIVTLLIRRFVEGEYFSFLVVLLVAITGVTGGRWLGAFIVILVLHNKDLREKPFSFLWWWIATSIFAIAWNPPLGGVVSISFLPLLISTFVAKKESLSRMFKSEFISLRNKISWGALVLAGLAFIPLFIQIVYILLAQSQQEVSKRLLVSSCLLSLSM
jgi:hypothetical protein